jgi:Domain of unknown function (DUF5916)/Carbohydrate family 9 binding domain-like
MLLALVLSLAAAGAPAERNARDVRAAHVDAVPVSGPAAVRISGELKEESWQRATAVDSFVQRDPQEGGAPSQKTEFRVAYDSATLYVKVRAFDTEPDKIKTYLTRRDGDSPSDWIRVLIDSYHDGRTAYEFAVNPSGVKQDRYWFNDNNRDDGWDAVWDVKVARDQSGWSAEFHIPFSQLRFTPGESNTFGFAVSRQIGRLNETSTWPLLPRGATGYVSSFGELGGLSLARSPKRLEMMPYTVGDLSRQRTGGNPLEKASDPGASFGVDVKYALTTGLTLTTTINPDFGQVEADPAVVNLSAFETFFSERRPFFVEGSGMFRFDSECMDGPCQMFYSRRVGRAPQATGELPSGDNIYTESPAQTTILGAGKLTGRVGGYSVGVMTALTQQEVGTVLEGATRFEKPVEPLTAYTIARIRREFKSQSAYGLMMTATNRGVKDVAAFLPNSAYTGGADWDLRIRKNYALTGFLSGSTVRGDAAAIDAIQQNSRHYFQRPDATSFSLLPGATSLNGAGGRVRFGQIGGESIRFNTEYGFKSPGFDLNDTGFLRRADQRWTANWFQLRNEKPNKYLRSRYINFNYFSTWNYDGDRLFSGGNVNASFNFVNNWSAGGGIGAQPHGFDDRVTRGGPGAVTEGVKNFWSWMNSDTRKPVSLNVFTGAGSAGDAGWFRDLELSVTVRPVSAITLTSGVRVNRNVSNVQWLENIVDAASKDHYAFGRIDQTTVGLTQRFNYTVSPNLSLQLYAEPFVSAGGYGNYVELANARSLDFNARYTPYAYGGDPDFNVKSFRTTNVVRWEYKPGSTLFVVWQQARENDAVPGGFRLGRDVRDIFGVAPRNVFLVKLAYWLNY